MDVLTERLHVRDPVPGDWHGAHTFLSDAEVMRWIHLGPAPFTEALTRAWLADLIHYNAETPRQTHNCVIVERASRQVVGWIGIGKPSPHRAHVGDLDFGYALAREHWGKGYMTEALRALLGFAFTELGANTVFAICETRNTGSYRVMEHAGMTRRERFEEDGKDMYLYTIQRDQWESHGRSGASSHTCAST